jgi:hypothetical protein
MKVLLYAVFKDLKGVTLPVPGPILDKRDRGTEEELAPSKLNSAVFAASFVPDIVARGLVCVSTLRPLASRQEQNPLANPSVRITGVRYDV